MDKIKIRNLRADEIEVRAQQVKQNGAVLLLYKDARCDMRILDETFGVMGWQREHAVINGNLYCAISIWDSEKQQWIKKADVGTEAKTEKEKSESSDSFKRAGVNIGIGRELYSSPFIWVNLSQKEVKENDFNGKKTYQLASGIGFHVASIKVDEEKRITELTIVDNNNVVRFCYVKKPVKEPTSNLKGNKKAATGPNKTREDMLAIILGMAAAIDISEKEVLDKAGKKYGDLTREDGKVLYEWLKAETEKFEKRKENA